MKNFCRGRGPQRRKKVTLHKIYIVRLETPWLRKLFTTIVQGFVFGREVLLITSYKNDTKKGEIFRREGVLEL